MIHIASLPRTDGPVSIAPARNAGSGGLLGRLETVLIIDDDATMRLALGCMIAEANRQIVLATSADDALERMPLINPDLILCDYLLDGTNGREFCQQLKAAPRWRYVPIIVVTRMDATGIHTDLLKSGADDVLIKPVRAAELRARVLCGLRTRARYFELRLGW